MHVRLREKFRATCSDPAFPGRSLALRAVSVATGVIREGAMSATGALVEMTAQGGGTTAPNGSQHFDALPAEPVAISFQASSARAAGEIGHLQCRPSHLFLLCCPPLQLQRVKRNGSCVQMALRKVLVDGGFFQIAMAQ